MAAEGDAVPGDELGSKAAPGIGWGHPDPDVEAVRYLAATVESDTHPQVVRASGPPQRVTDPGLRLYEIHVGGRYRKHVQDPVADIDDVLTVFGLDPEAWVAKWRYDDADPPIEVAFRPDRFHIVEAIDDSPGGLVASVPWDEDLRQEWADLVEHVRADRGGGPLPPGGSAAVTGIEREQAADLVAMIEARTDQD